MMNWLARILTHGFAIAVVALLALGYIYRGELFPEFDLPEQLGLDVGSKTEATTEPTDTAVTSEPAEAVTEAPVTEEMPAAEPTAEPVPEPSAESTDDAPEATQLPEEVTAPVADAAPATDADAGDGSEPEAATEAQPAEAVPVAETPVEAAPEPAAEPAPEPSAESAADAPEPARLPEEVAAPAAEAAPATEADTGDVSETATQPAEALPVTETPAAAPAEAAPDRSPNQILADAREAFWLRDHAAAESHYQQLIAAQPDNPDGYGELGNMYFSQGEWEKAASAYFEAGTRLVKEGQLPQARELVEVIRGLNGTQADELEQLIAAARSMPPGNDE